MFGHVACPRVLTDQLLIFWYIYIYMFSHVACPRVLSDQLLMFWYIYFQSRGLPTCEHWSEERRQVAQPLAWLADNVIFFLLCVRFYTQHGQRAVVSLLQYLVGHTTKRHADRVASQERCKRNATRSPGLHRYEEQTRRMLSPRPRYWRPYPHLPPPPPAASPAVELSTVADSHRRDRHVMMTAADSLLVRRRPPRQLLPPPAIPLASRQTGPRLPRECHWRRKRGWPVSGTGTSRGCPPRRRECPARRGGPGRPRSPRAGVRCSRWSRPSRWKQVVSIP